MEELKLILQTISDLGGDAKWLFIVYIVKDLFVYFAGFGCLFFAVFTLSKIIQGFIKSLSVVGRIKTKMGISGELYQRDVLNILQTLDKGLAYKNHGPDTPA